jgi:16S rRNA (cytidine1402-2'-O)-methyltransferase
MDMAIKKEQNKENYGKLYVVSTPIGNLEDITLRALKTLNNVDLIAAENVKYSKKLCRHYNIDTRLTSYNQHNRKTKEPELIKNIKSGHDIALITSAGTPAISDPGAVLINMAINEEIKVVPIPGPSAAVAALSVSGMHTESFVFRGFLSSKQGKRRRDIKNLISEFRTMIFYESSHRVQSMLMDLMEILGDRYIVVQRELTKVYEETIRGPISLVLDVLKGDRLKGEFTIVMEGIRGPSRTQVIDNNIKKIIEDLILDGRISTKEISEKLSADKGVPYRVIYKECIELKKKLQTGK